MTMYSRAMASVLISLVSLAGAAPASAGESKAGVFDKTQALIAASGVDCTLVEAQKVEPETRGGGRRGGGMGGGGGGDFGRPAGQDGRTFYEAGCAEGLGFILVVARSAPARAKMQPDAAGATAEPAPEFMNCLEVNEAADRNAFPARCGLKPDAKPIGRLQALATQAGLDCSLRAARGLGHTDKLSFFEVACAAKAQPGRKTSPDEGYVLVTDRAVRADKTLSALPCYDTQASAAMRCELTHVGPVVDALHRYVAENTSGCAPVSERLAGYARSGEKVFEVRCRNGDGYVARWLGERTFDTLLACGDRTVQGVCRLKDEAPKS
jgi:hypothetical protein